MDNLFEAETVGKQPKRAVVMVGRFQPPTAAHYLVINLMKKFSRQNDSITPIVAVVAGKETGKDLVKNPLSAEDRIKYMMASGKANGVKFVVASSAFAAFEEVRKAGYEPFAIAAGSDRATKYLELLDKYFLDKDGSKLEHVVVPGLSDRVDPDDDGVPSEEILRYAEEGEDIPPHLISGSMARLAVQLGMKKAFTKILGVDQKLSNMIFKKIEGNQKDFK